MQISTSLRSRILSPILCVLCVLCLSLLSPNAYSQDPDTEQKLRDAGAQVEIYKSTVDSEGQPVDLNIYLFNPKGHKATDKRPAIVFFFGGGWNGGKPTQFTKHCQYLADRGMVAMTADYRVASRQGTKAIACVSDGKSAVRWIRQNASKLGVDPHKIASGGGSAGGHVSACAGVIKTLDEPDEDSSVSSVPNAMVLFNPALVLAHSEGNPQLDKTKMAGLKKRIGAEPITISPFHHIAADIPATIIFHGKADTTVPYWTAEVFAKSMVKSGNRCELKGYEAQGHGFFNFTRKSGKYDETVKAMDKFLVSLSFLTPQTKQ